MEREEAGTVRENMRDDLARRERGRAQEGERGKRQGRIRPRWSSDILG